MKLKCGNVAASHYAPPRKVSVWRGNERPRIMRLCAECRTLFRQDGFRVVVDETEEGRKTMMTSRKAWAILKGGRRGFVQADDWTPALYPTRGSAKADAFVGQKVVRVEIRTTTQGKEGRR